MNIWNFIGSEKELYDAKTKPIADRYGLTVTELSILLFLANNPEHDTATEIVEMRHLSKSHVSISIRSLEEKGYLKKEHRNGNHRTEHLVILPSSRAVIRLGKQAQNNFIAKLTENFTKEEISQMENFAERIFSSVSLELQKTLKASLQE